MIEPPLALFESAPHAVPPDRVAVIQFAWRAEARADGQPTGTAEPMAVLIVDRAGSRAVPLRARPPDALQRLTSGARGPDRALRAAIGAAAWRAEGDRATVRAVRVEGGTVRPIGPERHVDPGERGPGGCYNGPHDGPRGSASGDA